MTNTLHLSGQEQSSGNGVSSPEPNLIAQSFIVTISVISVGQGGSITFKVQHSDDGSTWIDVPGLTTGPLSETGTTTVTLDRDLALLDRQRVVWTFDSANSATFAAHLIGTK